MKAFTRRSIIITGGSGGIGSAIGKQLLQDGHIVLVLDCNPPPFEGAEFIQVDCRMPGATAQAIREAMKTREFECLVNAVGVYRCNSLTNFTWEECEESWMVNTRAPVEAILAWADCRSQENRGVVVNISSAGARLGSRDLSYAMSKAALEGATRSLARSLASANVTVVCVAPGLVETSMSDAMPETRRSQHAEATLVGRAGRPEEVADCVAFILLGKSDYMSGSTINISSGLVW